MDELIKKSEMISLSGQDVFDLANRKTNVITYKELKNIKHIDEIMKNGACVILYMSDTHYGHWTCVFYRNNDKDKFGKKSKHIEFFDSYGISPDLEKRWVDEIDQKRLGVKQNYLSRLLSESGCKIEYNHHKFQEKGKIATCGRWVALRLNLRHISLDDFISLMGKKKRIELTPDFLVTALTLKF